jgi:hypothetical protein
MNSSIRFLALLGLLFSVLSHVGCSAYSVSGRAVVGSYNTVEFVPSNDPRLKKEGMSGILVEAVRDPDSLGRSVAGSGKSSGNGDITLVLDEFGVGWMKENWDLLVMMGGDLYTQNRVQMPAPGSDLRLLVVVSPGTEKHRSSLEEEQQRQLEDSGINVPDSSIFRR